MQATSIISHTDYQQPFTVSMVAAIVIAAHLFLVWQLLRTGIATASIGQGSHPIFASVIPGPAETPASAKNDLPAEEAKKPPTPPREIELPREQPRQKKFRTVRNTEKKMTSSHRKNRRKRRRISFLRRPPAIPDQDKHRLSRRRLRPRQLEPLQVPHRQTKMPEETMAPLAKPTWKRPPPSPFPRSDSKKRKNQIIRSNRVPAMNRATFPCSSSSIPMASCKKRG